MSPKKRETKKQKQRKHLVRIITQPICAIAFILLILSAITLVVRGISTTIIEHNAGVPAHWSIESAELPSTISIPVTYYDQISEDCTVATEIRQFEFTRCNISSSTVQPGIVKDHLGNDGLPIPTNITPNKSFLSTSWGVTGHDPVQPTDNFYRWFHEVDGKSKEISGRNIEFKKIGDKLYQYGGSDIFPLDDINFSDGDYYGKKKHNYHFTMKMSAPFYVTTTGDDYFEFEGDDDVWVFVNGKLVLDIGGLHSSIKGHFKINPDATITATVAGKSTIIDAELKSGMKTTIDLFYAERSTSEANCRITLNGMLQPIDTTPTLSSTITEQNLIEYTATLRNNDPDNSVRVESFGSFLTENSEDLGFLNLNSDNTIYSTDESWHALNIVAPSTSEAGFTITDEILLAPHGQPGDTLTIKYYLQPNEPDGQTDNIASFLISRGQTTAIVTAHDTISYSDLSTPEEPTDPEDNPNPPSDTDEDDTTPTPTPTVTVPITDDTIEDDDPSAPPLGEIHIVDSYTNGDGPFVPNTGLASFATIILSQPFIFVTLGVFALSFALYWQVRKY